MHKRRRRLPYQLYIMMIPAVVILFVYHYIPMAGITIAFQNFKPAFGLFGKQEWVGWDNFKFVFSQGTSWRIFRNTLIIACGKIILSNIVSVSASLMLNEVRRAKYKKTLQTLIFIPYFFSWVLLAIIFRDLFSYTGVFNNIRSAFGAEPVVFLANNNYFRPIIIVTDIWKTFGYNTIVYMAALSGVDPQLYEAASIDGATRMQKTFHITIPGIRATIILCAVLGLGNVLNAGFDQILNLYNPVVYETGDIIDTYVYRVGLVNAQYSLSAAVGLLKSAISCILISLSYWLASKFANYTIF